MILRRLRFVAALFVVAACALAAPASRADRHPVPHGSAPHGGAPSSAHGTATRGTVPPRAHANGTAHYGYYHGYYGGYPGYGWGYYPWWGYWGGYYPGWSVGFNFGWNGYYGDPYYYGPSYGYYGPGYYAMPGEPAPSGPVIVETGVSPKDADVVVDGEIAGSAKDFNGRWDELRLTPGTHTLEFRKAGYRSLIVELNAHAGGLYRINESLSPGSGEVRHSVGVPASSAAPGSSSAAGAPGGNEAGAPGLSLSTGIEKGLVRLHVTPDDAVVYLDGQFLGLGSELARLHGALPVATGEHRLEVVRPGFAPDVRTIVVDGKGTSEVEVALAPAR